MPIKERVRIDVKHVKDVIEFWTHYEEADSAAGATNAINEARLYHIYESNEKIFIVSVNGDVMDSEFKK